MSSPSTFSSPARRAGLAALACAALATALLLAGGGAAPAAQAKPAKMRQPNIVVVVADDQAKSTMLPESMPNLFQRLMPRGTTFTNYSVTTPLCCPSRAAYMTGEYGHNNGVLHNFYPDLKQKKNVLPSWLQHAGYTTAHVGKFLNSYEQGRLGPAAVAPGWDLWFTQLEKRRYYNWKASKNGKVIRFGSDDDDHVTKVTSDYAARWTRRLAKRDAPFYMQVDFYAPHTSTGRDKRCASGPVPEPVDEHRFDDHALPIPPNFNEADVTDKPDDIKQRPQLTPDDVATITRRYRCGLEAVYGVDRGVGRMLRLLKRKQELKNTVFVYTSDNGFFYGEHRIAKGKPDPYEENVNMPLTIVVPPRYRDGAELVPTSDAPVANIDLAPTLLELAGAKPCRARGICRTMDGRSLMPIMNGQGGFPQSRGVGLEIEGCQYRGARADGLVYIEHSSMQAGVCQRTDTELYDLGSDPYQLENLFPAPDGSQAQQEIDRMREMTGEIEDCAGIEGRDPEPASGHYCP